MVFLHLLSLSVNILCLIQKCPQIYRIFRSRNVDSVSASSVLLEELSYTLVLTYNVWREYPLSTYFEYIFLFAQDLLLLWAISKYSNQPENSNEKKTPIYSIGGFSLYVLISYFGLLPSAWMKICTMFVIPISASSKIIQLKTILTNKSSGQVSREGWLIASYNNFARIITNLVETKDSNMVLNLFISLLLNFSIVVACTIYRNGPARKRKDKTKKKK